MNINYSLKVGLTYEYFVLEQIKKDYDNGIGKIFLKN
jgi:hypothetical protein